jgi:hypothetical protein
LYVNLSVKGVRKIIVNGSDVTQRGLYERHRIRLWKVKESLVIGDSNTIEIEYHQLYNTNRVGLHSF